MTSPGTNDVLRSFNRDTARLFVWLLAGLVVAASGFAFLLPEPYRERAGLRGTAGQTKSAPALAPDDAELFKTADATEERSPNQTPSAKLADINQEPLESPFRESDANIGVAAGSTSAPILIFPKPNASIVTNNVGSWSSAQRKKSPREIKGKLLYRKETSSSGLTEAAVKKRLIELWHQSLVRTEARSWTIFSKLDTRKKAAFTSRKQP